MKLLKSDFPFLCTVNLRKAIMVASVFTLLLSGCEQQEQPLLYQVKKQSFDIVIPAEGELLSAKATVISAPSGGRSKVISWLEEEYSFVKKGQVIVMLDGEALRVASKDKRNEIAITEQDEKEQEGDLSQQRSDISEDISLVSTEKDFAQKYNIDDINIRSKLEIIDSMQNTEFLQSKENYLNWKNDSFANSAAGKRSLLDMKKAQIEQKLSQLNDGLSQLEIKAPHDGILIYTQNWRGEKVRAGQTIWGGQKIAQLPDVSQMQLKLHVDESEAINLAKDQKVSFVLNAQAGKIFSGVVISVSPYPQSIERGNPLKFFDVIVKIDKQQKFFAVGNKVNAMITVQMPEDKLIVPLQSVFSKDNSNYVFVYDDGKYQKTSVTLGQSNLSHVEIITGLISGQSITLFEQEVE